MISLDNRLCKQNSDIFLKLKYLNPFNPREYFLKTVNAK